MFVKSVKIKKFLIVKENALEVELPNVLFLIALNVIKPKMIMVVENVKRIITEH